MLWSINTIMLIFESRCLAFENTISELIRIYEANPEYGIISPLQVNAGLNKLDKNFQKCCNLEMLSDSFVDVLSRYMKLILLWLLIGLYQENVLNK